MTETKSIHRSASTSYEFLVAWLDIIMDFVFQLPRTSRGRECICIVVDRFLKVAHFNPCHKSDDATHVASLFVEHLHKLHAVTTTIVSDRNLSFLVILDLLFSTSCHPQT